MVTTGETPTPTSTQSSTSTSPSGSPSTPVSPRRRLARVDRSAQLVRVAAAVFAEHGVTAVSMDAVAERAGVTKPVLYDHFGSRDGLLAAVVQQAGRELRELTSAAVADARVDPDLDADPAGAERALAGGLRAYLQFVAANGPAWMALVEGTAAGPAAAAALEEVRAAQASDIAELARHWLPAGPTDVAERAAVYAQLMVGAAERLAFWRQRSGGIGIDEAVERLMDVLWVGLGGLAAGGGWQPRR